jgi:hypothetical protein
MLFSWARRLKGWRALNLKIFNPKAQEMRVGRRIKRMKPGLLPSKATPSVAEIPELPIVLRVDLETALSCVCDIEEMCCRE